MLAADIPIKFSIPFANGASGTYKAAIPTASQIGTNPGRASLTDGFVPLNFAPVASGGIPPFGKDVNGILFEISGWSRWQQAGGPIIYDAAFATAIGGYPAGAIISSNPAGLLWLCTADSNTTNPDTGGANWSLLMPVKAPDPLDTGDDTNFLTPAGAVALLDQGPQPPDALYAQNGFYTRPGGLIDQWGRFNITGPSANLTVSFPTPFPNACFSVVAAGGNNTTAQDNQVTLVGSSITQTQFQVRFVPTGTVQGTFIALGN